METYHPPKEAEDKEDKSDLPEREVLSEKWLLEKIDSLIPLIKEKWPNIAKQSLDKDIFLKDGPFYLITCIRNKS